MADEAVEGGFQNTVAGVTGTAGVADAGGGKGLRAATARATARVLNVRS
jgi:hypothetical protein